MVGTKVKSFLRNRNTLLITIIVVFVAFFTAINSNYLSARNLTALMSAISLPGILAPGLVCLLIAGHIDLAAGVEAVMAAVIGSLLMQSGMPWPLALALALLFGCVMGLVNSFLVNVMGFMAFIATIGMTKVYTGLARVATGGGSISISNTQFFNLNSFSITIGNLAIPLPFIITVVLFISYALLLKYTKFGRNIYMCGGDRFAARLVGISQKKITTILFMNCGALAALSGMINSAGTHSANPNNILMTEMDCIAAAVLGGVSFMGGSGGMGGAFIGLVFVNAFNNGLNNIGVPSYWQNVVRGAILIVALLVNFFGERARSRALKESSEGSVA